MQNNYLLVLFLPICPTDGQDDRREKIFRRSSVKTVKTDVFLFEIDYCTPEMDSGELIYKGWLAIAKLKPLSLFMSLLSNSKESI